MTTTGFTISKIVVDGQGKADAVLAFGPGLNVVAGASNTGKTYAWQLLDFMLGASRSPKNIPAAAGYTDATMEVLTREDGVLTLSRALAGGDALVYRGAIDEITGDSPSVTLAERHAAGDRDTISGRLLEWTALFGKQIRQDARGKKRSLSFRDVAWLCLVDEERIITEGSPALSVQYTKVTEKRSVFGLFLTGTDDSAIVIQEKPKDRKQRLEMEMSVLEGLLEEREERLETFAIEVEKIPNEQDRLAREIEEGTAMLLVRQSELDESAAARDDAWSELQTIKARRLFLGEQIKRLQLLQQHYGSDEARLASALEAGEIMERLPEGECPVCGHKPDDGDIVATEARLREFQEACNAELSKIAALTEDLDSSLAAMRSEDRHREAEEEDLGSVLREANTAINGLLEQNVAAVDEELSTLLAQQMRLSQAAFTANEVLDLRARYSAAEQQSKQRIPKPKFAKKVEAAGTVEFCQVVESTLRAWKFPFREAVSWSDDRFDLVVGDENRGSMGKGYRAVTHAAFIVGLMRYCRAKGWPHPGIVVLDTPLNPYRGADRTDKEGMNMEVQEAFYSDLAADESGDQVIVFENTEPPHAVRSLMRYTHFSGNPANPPAGFYTLSD